MLKERKEERCRSRVAFPSWRVALSPLRPLREQHEALPVKALCSFQRTNNDAPREPLFSPRVDAFSSSLLDSTASTSLHSTLSTASQVFCMSPSLGLQFISDAGFSTPTCLDLPRSATVCTFSVALPMCVWRVLAEGSVGANWDSRAPGLLHTRG
jgi:hypothetical protein